MHQTVLKVTRTLRGSHYLDASDYRNHLELLFPSLFSHDIPMTPGNVVGLDKPDEARTTILHCYVAQAILSGGSERLGHEGGVLCANPRDEMSPELQPVTP